MRSDAFQESDGLSLEYFIDKSMPVMVRRQTPMDTFFYSVANRHDLAHLDGLPGGGSFRTGL